MADIFENIKLGIKKFDGKDYILWKDRIENALEASKCFDAINEDFDPAEGDEEEKKNKKELNIKAKLIIMSSMTDDILRKVPRESAKTIWKTLKNRYEEKNGPSILATERNFLTSKQSANETVESFIDKIQSMRESIEASGNKISDEDTAMTILYGLLPSYENFVQCITISKKNIVLDEVIVELIAEEKRRSNKGINSNTESEIAFHSSNQRTFSRYSNNNNKTNFKRKTIFKEMKCFNCDKTGHYARDCRLPRKEKDQNKRANYNVEKSKPKNENNFACYADNDDSAVRKIWLLDSGATNHICCLRYKFSKIKPYNSTIKVGDGRKLKVEGIGEVNLKIQSNNGIIILQLQQVLFVPKLSTNLLSIGKLTQKGYNLVFNREMCVIRFNEKFNAEALRSKHNNNLYELKIFDEGQVYLIEKSIDWKLWHHRLGHLGMKNMQRIKTKDIDLSSKSLQSEFCESCALGKATKLPHKTIEKTDGKGDAIHSDIVGPIRTMSIGQKRYILTYLCSRTEYSFVYFLKSKAEQFEKFKEFKNYYEGLTETKIKELRTDNGTEYLPIVFQQYLKQNGIKHNTSVEYCPQSNGKAERLNRTLIEKARCMLIASKVNLNLWAAAVNTANYLRNRSPSSALNGKSPYEALFNRLPKISHFKVFGCPAYPLDLNKKGDKFEPNAKPNCIMIGYGESDGIYWVLNKSNGKVFRSRDIKFNEDPILKTNLNDEVDLADLLKPFENNDNSNEDENEEENDTSVETDTLNDNEADEDEFQDLRDEQMKHEMKEEVNKFEKFSESENDEKFETPRESIDIGIKEKRNRKQTKFYKAGESDTGNKAKVKINDKKANYVESVEFKNEPKTYEEALKCSFREKWKEAIQSELDSLNENETWSIAKLPKDKKTIKTKWLFKIKMDSKNNPERFKARLVAKGYDQEEGIDYGETFAPVVKQQSLRLLLAISVNENLKMHHIDISTAFLYGEIDEEVYIEPPEGIKDTLEENVVLKLNKALYGLKQASRSWNKTLVNFLNELGFRQLKSDTCIFYNETLIIAIYVDDIIILSKDIVMIEEFKRQISLKFKTKDLGKLRYVLGISIEQINEEILLINQKNYITNIIEKFRNLEESREVNIPIQPNHNLTNDLITENETLRHFVDPTRYRQVIGSLIYLMTNTRPDICYAVSVLSRFMQQPRELHWRFLKRLLRYIKTTCNYSIIYQKSKSTDSLLTGYSDSDFAGSIDDRKSTSGYVFKYGECLISWNSCKQKTVSLSSTEAEYIALTNAIKEIVWFKQMLSELKRETKELKLFCDNKSTIYLSKNPEFHSRTKHIDIRHHYIRETINNNSIKIIYISTDEMPADILTKALPKIKHDKCLKLLGIGLKMNEQYSLVTGFEENKEFRLHRKETEEKLILKH